MYRWLGDSGLRRAPGIGRLARSGSSKSCGGDTMGHGVPRYVALLILGASLVLAVPACKSAPPAEAPVTTAPDFSSAPSKAEKVEEATGFKESQPEAEAVKECSSSLAEKLNAQGALKRVHFDFDKYDLRSD